MCIVGSIGPGPAGCLTRPLAVISSRFYADTVRGDPGARRCDLVVRRASYYAGSVFYSPRLAGHLAQRDVRTWNVLKLCRASIRIHRRVVSCSLRSRSFVSMAFESLAADHVSVPVVFRAPFNLSEIWAFWRGGISALYGVSGARNRRADLARMEPVSLDAPT